MKKETIDTDYWESASGKVKLSEQSIGYLENILNFIQKTQKRTEYTKPIIDIINYKKYGY